MGSSYAAVKPDRNKMRLLSYCILGCLCVVLLTHCVQCEGDDDRQQRTFCAPGYFDPHTGIGLPFFCAPCGYGFFCRDGATQEQCPAGSTTTTDTASSIEECIEHEPPGPPPEPPTKCNPCSEVNPDVIMTTGNGAHPPNGLWRIRRWRPVQDLVPEFLCSLQGMAGMVADVAIRPNGDILIIDLECNMYILDKATYAALKPSKDVNTKCHPTPVYKISVPEGHTCTGIAAGTWSNQLVLSTNRGDVFNIELSGEPGTSRKNHIQARVLARCDPLSANMGSEGGTDTSIAPDGFFYRWTAKDYASRYSSTRFELDSHTGLLTGEYAYTDRDVDGRQPSNAGTFCTRDFLVGVGVTVNPDGDVGSFYAYGLGRPADEAPEQLPHMPMVAQTVTTDWHSSLRVNGAANRPTCGL